MLKAVLISLTLVLFPCLSQGAVYFIEPDGGGDFPTIQEAIDASVDGDSILLSDGIFDTVEHGYTTVGIVYWGKGITIASISGDPSTCRLDGGGFLPVNFSQYEDSSSVLDGVTVQNGGGENGGGIHIRRASPIIRNCVVEFNRCRIGAGVHITEHSSPTITNCIIRSNTGTIYGTAWGGGFSCDYNGTGEPRIENCVIEHNISNCLGPLSSGGGGGLYFSQSIHPIRNCIIRYNEGSTGAAMWARGSVSMENCLIYGNESESVGSALTYQTSQGHPSYIQNCTIADNSSLESGSAIYMSRLLYQAPPGSLIVSNSIVAFNGPGPAFAFGEDQGPIALSRCDVYGNEGGDWTGPLADQLGYYGNFSADPLFCDLEGGDLHLASGSPCLIGLDSSSGPIGALGWGCDSPTTALPPSTSAENLELLPNFPNPFNGRTTFRFILTKPERVTVDILDVSGRRVARLMDGEQRPVGVTSLDWDGRDAKGLRVSTGIYLVQVRAGESRLSRPVMFLK